MSDLKPPVHYRGEQALREVYADPGRNGFYYREKMPDSVARYIWDKDVEAQTAALRAENERLRGELSWCVRHLVELVKESDRPLEYGEEDVFRMGEWFQPEELNRIAEIHDALPSADGEQS